MAEKVWVHPDCIDPNFVHQRFPSILPKEVLKRLIFPKQELNPSAFYYPRLGYQQLWDNIARMVTREGQRLIYSSEPVRIDVENNQIVRVVVKTPQGENEFESDDFYVVSTIPITTLVRLLPGGFESLRERVKSIKTRSMVLAVFELNEPRALPFRVLIYPEQRYCFNRLYEQNEYSRETIEKGKSVIVADITVPRGDKLMSAPDDEILARVKTDISKLGYVRVKNICDSCVRRVEYAYVVPDIETRKAFFEISHELKAISNCTLMGRFGIGEYDNSDYAIDAGLTLGGYLTRRISKLEYLRQSYQKRSRYIVG